MRRISGFKMYLIVGAASSLLAQDQPEWVYAQTAPYPDRSTWQLAPSTDTWISHLAQQMSVRILGDQSSGSGVIINHQGQRYTVVTNAHVVEDNPEQRYTVVTADGNTYQGIWLTGVRVYSQDIAIVQFQSDRAYAVAQFRDLRDLQVGEPVYSVGFPNWHWLGANNIEDTQSWGFRAFQLTVGQVGMLLPQPLMQGYQLGYTNDVDPGMSGGAVLDRQGRLIGINGALKNPPQGITAFAFANGALPPEPLFQAMNSLSWAIPVFTIQSFLSTHSPSAALP